MVEEIIMRPRVLGQDRQLVTPIDQLRASDFAVGSLASGAHLSGGGVTLRAVSGPVIIRPMNVELYNLESVFYEVEYRDGGFLGGRVLGPYRILPYGEKRLAQEELMGHRFTSSVYLMVISGAAATMTSGAGIRAGMGFIQEPRDFYE